MGIYSDCTEVEHKHNTGSKVHRIFFCFFPIRKVRGEYLCVYYFFSSRFQSPISTWRTKILFYLFKNILFPFLAPGLGSSPIPLFLLCSFMVGHFLCSWIYRKMIKKHTLNRSSMSPCMGPLQHHISHFICHLLLWILLLAHYAIYSSGFLWWRSCCVEIIIKAACWSPVMLNRIL